MLNPFSLSPGPASLFRLFLHFIEFALSSDVSTFTFGRVFWFLYFWILLSIVQVDARFKFILTGKASLVAHLRSKQRGHGIHLQPLHEILHCA
jgi:hypothetical protein